MRIDSLARVAGLLAPERVSDEEFGKTFSRMVLSDFRLFAEVISANTGVSRIIGAILFLLNFSAIPSVGCSIVIGQGSWWM